MLWARGIYRSRVSRALDRDDIQAIEGAVERAISRSRNQFVSELVRGLWVFMWIAVLVWAAVQYGGTVLAWALALIVSLQH
jgi:hypothetical protein